ncbi:MAG: hypothetical protein ACI86M_000307 [Saprospiraceae bacterium]|jgi:hypothetical protein
MITPFRSLFNRYVFFLYMKNGSIYIDSTIDLLCNKFSSETLHRINRKMIVSTVSLSGNNYYFNNRLKLDLSPIDTI